MLQAATALWPEVFERDDVLARKDEVIEDMRIVRPVVETGCVGDFFLSSSSSSSFSFLSIECSECA